MADILSACVAVDDGVVFVSDPTHDVAVPLDTNISPVMSTPSCIAVRTIETTDGTVMIHLASHFDKTARALIFEGELETPGRRVDIGLTRADVIVSMPVERQVTRISIWVDDLLQPQQVCVQAA